MQAEERRQSIRNILAVAETPVSATALAAKFSVSRQVIVGDIALLRAAGLDIAATPRGYVVHRSPEGKIYQLAVQHTPEEMEAELNAIVDEGGVALDVIVEHPVYGQLTGPLQISNRHEVRQFVQRCALLEAAPLSTLTEGIHLHTIACAGDEVFQRICDALRALGFLLEA